MNIRENKNFTEVGQIIYLVAIGIVLLFGFLGLAVDGGRLYSENRRAQHAADNAAMTGALYIGQNYQILETQGESAARDCNGGGILCLSGISGEIALESAGFYISNLLVDYAVEAQPSPYSGIKYVDVEVVLEVEIEPYFAKVFTDQPLRTTVVAVSRVYPRQNFAFGYSMLSTDQDVCDGITIEGSVDILLASGGLHSNSSDPSCDAILVSGAAGTDVSIIGPFTGSSTLGLNGNPDIISTFEYGYVPPMTMPPIDTPVCEDPEPYSYDELTDTGTYYPGNQSHMQFETPGTVIFEPGIYCVHGDLQILGGTFYGEGVMFYIDDGEVFIGGNPELHISAPQDSGTIYDGLLIYMNPENEGEIQIVGNAESDLSGTIYAPGPAPLPQPKCDLTGTSVAKDESINYSIQLICSTIWVHGNTTLHLSFDDDLLYAPPPELSLLH